MVAVEVHDGVECHNERALVVLVADEEDLGRVGDVRLRDADVVAGLAAIVVPA